MVEWQSHRKGLNLLTHSGCVKIRTFCLAHIALVNLAVKLYLGISIVMQFEWFELYQNEHLLCSNSSAWLDSSVYIELVYA